MASPSKLPALRRPAGSSRPVSMIEGPMMNAPNFGTASLEESSKKTKRRSLLPQFSRRSPTEEQEQRSSRESKRNATSRDGDNGGQSFEEQRASTESNARRGLDQERAAMPPPATKLSRPMSMVPPRVSSQTSKLPNKRSHAHAASVSLEKPVDQETAWAQSLSALTGQAPAASVDESNTADLNPGSSRPGSSRLPQAFQPGSPMIPSRTTSARTSTRTVAKKPASQVKASQLSTSTTVGPNESKTTTERRKQSADAPIPTQRQIRPSSVVSSHHQKSSSGTVGETKLQITPPQVSATSRPRPTSMIMPPPSKPAFNTYQQHYSPAKSSLPKPHVPPAKHSSKPSVSIDAEDSGGLEALKLQVELLQLSLLHQSSGKCLDEYTGSAKRKLGKAHSKLRRDYEDLRAMELVYQRASNLHALDSWCPNSALLVENLQILSLVYSDLTSLMDEGSRHGDLVSMYELWMTEAETASSAAFIQPLPEDWRASHGALTLKLRTIQRNLRVLPPFQASGPSTGVQMVLTACKTLAEDMLKELEVMVKLEKEMLAKEKTKVESEVASLVGRKNGLTNAWTPAWQRVQ